MEGWEGRRKDGNYVEMKMLSERGSRWYYNKHTLHSVKYKLSRFMIHHHPRLTFMIQTSHEQARDLMNPYKHGRKAASQILSTVYKASHDTLAPDPCDDSAYVDCILIESVDTISIVECWFFSFVDFGISSINWTKRTDAGREYLKPHNNFEILFR